MKNYSLDLLAGEQAMLFHGYQTYRWDRDFVPMADEVAGLLDSLDHPIFVIADMTEMSANLTDLIFSTNYATRIGNAFLRHQNMREFLAVTASRAIALAAQGMSSPIFGSVPVRVFENVDDALAYAQAHAERQAG